MVYSVLDNLIATIDSRKAASADSSYTASLFAGAPEKPLRKLTEETTELLIEIMKNDKAASTKEAADVLYHFLVVLAASDISFADVLSELAQREGVSGHEEKRQRSD